MHVDVLFILIVDIQLYLLNIFSLRVYTIYAGYGGIGCFQQYRDSYRYREQKVVLILVLVLCCHIGIAPSLWEQYSVSRHRISVVSGLFEQYRDPYRFRE